MKRVLAVILVIAMVFSLAACGKEGKAENVCSSCGESISQEATSCEHCGAAINNTANESENTSGDNSTTAENTETKPADTTSTPAPSTPAPSTPTTSTHTHSYSKTVIAATCTAMGYTIYSCSCGHSYKWEFTSHAPHSYSEYACSACGAVDKEHAYEFLLNFVLRNGKLDIKTGNINYIYKEEKKIIGHLMPG